MMLSNERGYRMSALQGVSSAVILTLKGSLWEPRHDLIDVPNAE